jgi:hypothetical protein
VRATIGYTRLLAEDPHVTMRRRSAALLGLMAAMSCGRDPGQDDAADGGGADSALAAPTADSAAGPMIHPPGPGVPGAVGDSAPVGVAPDTAVWTTGRAFAPPTVAYAPLPVLTALRTGTHAAYERLTVEMGEAAGLPSYNAEYVDRPLIECGSGNQVFPVGDAWLELRLEPAAAHTEAGQPTLGEREIPVGGPLLLRVHRTCDFEGVVTLVLALAAPNPFRVLTLADPWRIVLDVQR